MTMSHQTACAFFTSTNILTNQIKSCPNLERLSLQNIRLNDAVAKLVLQIFDKTHSAQDLADILTQPGLRKLREINISATGTTKLNNYK